MVTQKLKLDVKINRNENNDTVAWWSEESFYVLRYDADYEGEADEVSDEKTEEQTNKITI